MKDSFKTANEIQELKNNWLNDPCYNIEETEGFERYKTELLEFRLAKEKEWEARWGKKVAKKQEELGTTSFKLAEYIIRLENKIEKLESKLC